MYELRDYQQQASERAVAFFKGKYKGNAIEVLPTGCHAKGTEILMFNGENKNVEDINIGEYIMGANGSPRKVLRLCRGNEMMYNITPNKGGGRFA